MWLGFWAGAPLCTLLPPGPHLLPSTLELTGSIQMSTTDTWSRSFCIPRLTDRGTCTWALGPPLSPIFGFGLRDTERLRERSPSTASPLKPATERPALHQGQELSAPPSRSPTCLGHPSCLPGCASAGSCNQLGLEPRPSKVGQQHLTTEPMPNSHPPQTSPPSDLLSMQHLPP